MIHIAGYPVRVGDKCRQRCAWCDHVLVDRDLSLEMTAPGSAPERAWHFEIGTLVEVRGNGTWVVVDDGEKLPLGACANPRPPLRAVDPA